MTLWCSRNTPMYLSNQLIIWSPVSLHRRRKILIIRITKAKLLSKATGSEAKVTSAPATSFTLALNVRWMSMASGGWLFKMSRTTRKLSASKLACLPEPLAVHWLLAIAAPVSRNTSIIVCSPLTLATLTKDCLLTFSNCHQPALAAFLLNSLNPFTIQALAWKVTKFISEQLQLYFLHSLI